MKRALLNEGKRIDRTNHASQVPIGEEVITESEDQHRKDSTNHASQAPLGEKVTVTVSAKGGQASAS